MSEVERNGDHPDERPAAPMRESGDGAAPNDVPADEYNASVGAVMAARKAYESALTAFGADSWGAQQAREDLDRQIRHRDEMRAVHDKAERRRSND